MGWLYERSMTALVVFSVITQLAAVPVLLVVARRLRRLNSTGKLIISSPSGLERAQCPLIDRQDLLLPADR